MARKWIYPYNNLSKSAIALARGLESMLIKTKDSKFVPTKEKQIINWGSSDENIRKYREGVGVVYNWPSAIDRCANKTTFFASLEGNKIDVDNPQSTAPRIPPWTNDRNVAMQWKNDGILVLGRTNPRGRGGEGIIFSDDENQDGAFVHECSLWTRYVPKAKEFRVHIVAGNIIDVTEKKLRTHDDDGKPVEKDKINWRVRSHSNGFIFARENIQVPDDVAIQALRAFRLIPNLHFGAFDVIYNAKHNKAYVLECNTAPGIEGTTLDNYVAAFKRM